MVLTIIKIRVQVVSMEATIAEVMDLVMDLVLLIIIHNQEICMVVFGMLDKNKMLTHSLFFFLPYLL
jgi:hypothetical protein